MRWTFAVSQQAQKMPPLSSAEIGCFAVHQGDLLWDEDARRCLRRFVPPRSLPIDLNVGYKSYVAKGQRLAEDHQRLLAAKKKYDSGRDFDVVTYRNNLNTICQTPYVSNAWEMGVRRCEDESIVLSIRSYHHSVDRSSYYGYSFETAATGGDYPVDGNEEFVACSRVSLGDHQLFVCAEMDCFDDGYVELKTCKLLNHERAVRTFERYKLLKFWVQSKLVDVKTIVCGFRDDEGIVTKIQRFKTADIPGYARREWSDTVVLGFLDQVIQFVKNSLDQAPPDLQYFDLAYKPSQNLLVLQPSVEKRTRRSPSPPARNKKPRSES